MKKILLLVNILVAFATMVACTGDEEHPNEGNSAHPEYINNRGGGQVILGHQLENSYSVENMRAAYRKLRQLEQIDSIERIDTTHLYIRFYPRTAEEVTMLVEDSTIVVFPYPLDYELIGDGVYEPDPTEPPYLYSVVPVEYGYRSFSDYTILDYCHIPDIDNYPDLEILEQTALEMTGNYIETPSTKCGNSPHGKIEVYNNATERDEGVRNVHVVMNTLLRVRKTTTDTAGNYSISKKFLTNVNYTVYFHNPNASFQIWGNHFCLMPATLSLGIHSNSGYSRKIAESTREWQWASLNNAISIYKNQLCPSLNILPPPSNLRVAVLDLDFDNWAGSAPMLRHWSCASCDIDGFMNQLGVLIGSGGLLMLDRMVPDIIILANYSLTKNVYSNIFHELSHASHSVLVSGSYWFYFCLAAVLNNQSGQYGTPSSDLSGYIGVGEMWAFFAEIVFMNENIKNVWHKTDTVRIDTLAEYDTISTYWFKPHTLGELVGPDRTYMRFDSIYRSLNATSITEFKNNLKNRITDYQPYVIDSIFAKHGF